MEDKSRRSLADRLDTHLKMKKLVAEISGSEVVSRRIHPEISISSSEELLQALKLLGGADKAQPLIWELLLLVDHCFPVEDGDSTTLDSYKFATNRPRVVPTAAEELNLWKELTESCEQMSKLLRKVSESIAAGSFKTEDSKQNAVRKQRYTLVMELTAAIDVRDELIMLTPHKASAGAKRQNHNCRFRHAAGILISLLLEKGMTQAQLATLVKQSKNDWEEHPPLRSCTLRRIRSKKGAAQLRALLSRLSKEGQAARESFRNRGY